MARKADLHERSLLRVLYAGPIWNLEDNDDYDGIFAILTVQLSVVEGAQATLFWEDETLPFTDSTWGFTVGYIPAGVGGSIDFGFAWYYKGREWQLAPN